MNNDDRRDEAANKYANRVAMPMLRSMYYTSRTMFALDLRNSVQFGWNKCRETEVAPLLARVGKLEEALRFYADPSSCFSSDSYCAVWEGWEYKNMDKKPIEVGTLARAALAETQPGGEE